MFTFFFDFQLLELFFQYLAEIEDHLNITIQQVDPDMKVPMNDFDGKVIYGEKRAAMGM